ncbi:uncharacterized protein LOC128555751 isoform X2 [Mercenaria mercenaria]|uniref:uncharacterized protein LOC128555751 isoform X2 n=1 Tax=Mercenaria mercenaria TaxID=6596 RepID=UPI00234F15E7|nr:uncharacterized protein LOC128555751 isoform X2 [Mercenaria mercenaria]
MELILITFLLILILIPSSIQKGSETDVTCKPYRAYIIWDMYEEDSSYFLHRRVASELIDGMPDSSVIRLKAVGADSFDSLHFTKDNTNTSWTDMIVNIKAGHLKHHTIPYSIIRKDVYDALGHRSSPKMAEVFFLLVNGRSQIDRKKKAIAELKTKKTFVVFAGKSDPADVWTSIATNKDHVLKLNDSGQNDYEDFLNVVNTDSRLYCDTNMYWDGKVCYRCSYICTQTRSEYCHFECPFV